MADSRQFKNGFIDISAVDHPISIKFGRLMQISIPITLARQNRPINILQIQNSGRPPH